MWKSLFHDRFKVQATNAYCVPLLSYGFGIVEWTKAELTHFDVLTRKNYDCYHPRAAVERLYLPRHMGGCGLLNTEHLYQRRFLVLSYHLQTSSDILVRECFNLISQMTSFKSLLSKATKLASELGLINTSHFTSGQLKNAICSAQYQKLTSILCEKPLHGRFFNQLRSVVVVFCG